MKTSILLNREMNDIVFENRNKSYGAFVLRQDYERNMSRAMITAFLFFLCCINSPNVIRLLQDRSSSVDHITYDNTPVNLDPMRNLAPVVKPPVVIPQKTPPSIKSQIKYVEPAVKPDDLVPEAVDIPLIDQLVNVQTGSTTIHNPEGTIDAGIAVDFSSSSAIAETPDESTVFNSYAVEQQPEFPDGMAAMYTFLKNNLDYPQLAIEMGLSGTVFIQFVVTKEGLIQNATVVRGLGGGLNQEALRVVNLMPPWKPGKHNGKAVAVNFILPIKFQLLK
jgi:protein TonB